MFFRSSRSIMGFPLKVHITCPHTADDTGLFLSHGGNMSNAERDQTTKEMTYGHHGDAAVSWLLFTTRFSSAERVFKCPEAAAGGLAERSRLLTSRSQRRADGYWSSWAAERREERRPSRTRPSKRRVSFAKKAQIVKWRASAPVATDRTQAL